MERRKLMLKQKFTAVLATAAALVLLAVPAFAADAAPQADPAAVQPQITQEEPAPSDETPVPEEPKPQITYVALGDSITAGVGLSDLQYNVAQIGFDLQPNFEGYSSRCYTALVGKGLGLDRQHAINLGLPGLMSADLLDMVRSGGMPQMNQASGSYYVYPEYQEYLRNADVLIVGGTSLNVYPAAGLINYYRGNKLVLVNLSETPYDSCADLIIHEKIGEVFSQI